MSRRGSSVVRLSSLPNTHAHTDGDTYFFAGPHLEIYDNRPRKSGQDEIHKSGICCSVHESLTRSSYVIMDIPAAKIVTPSIRSLFQQAPLAWEVGRHCTHLSTTLTHVIPFMEMMIIRSITLSRGPAILISVIANDVLLHIAATKNRVPVYSNVSIADCVVLST